MKTFLQFLGEMSLKHYQTDFKVPTSAYRREAFSKKDDGSTNFSNQIKLEPTISISGRFSKKDRSILSHPRTFRVLEEKLRNSGYDFNILMMDRETPPRGWGWRREIKKEWLKKEAKELLEGEGVPTAGRITFVKTGTTGHLMKPWMVLHTLAHAVFEENGFRLNLEPKIQGETNKLTQNGAVPLSQIFMFSSASAQEESGLEGHNDKELQHELMAEFLWNGRIRVRSSEQEEAAQKIEQILEALLRGCVGKIIIHDD